MIYSFGPKAKRFLSSFRTVRRPFPCRLFLPSLRCQTSAAVLRRQVLLYHIRMFPVNCRTHFFLKFYEFSLFFCSFPDPVRISASFFHAADEFRKESEHNVSGVRHGFRSKAFDGPAGGRKRDGIFFQSPCSQCDRRNARRGNRTKVYFRG